MTEGNTSTKRKYLPKHLREVVDFIRMAHREESLWPSVYGMKKPADLCDGFLAALDSLSEQTGVARNPARRASYDEQFIRAALRALGESADANPAVRELVRYVAEFKRRRPVLTAPKFSREVERMDWPERIPG